VPVFLVLGLGYFAFVLYPVSSSASSVRDSLRSANLYLLDAGKSREEREIKDRASYVKKRILAPLKEARAEDPENVRVLLYLAEWHGQLWSLDPSDQIASGVAHDGLVYAAQAWRLEPHGPEGALTTYGLRTRFKSWFQARAQGFEKQADDPKSKLKEDERKRRRALAARFWTQAREQQDLGVEALQRASVKDPTSARIPYLLARELFDLEKHLNEMVSKLEAEAGRQSGIDADRTREMAEQARAEARKVRTEALEHAEEAQRLDELVKVSSRRLTATQRGQLEKWLAPPAPAPAPEPPES
jgi:hypothetical protein